ncbi:MAG TPA: 5-formyltetrahydrofolate cyclo-ligase [Rhodospirillaceae bacterium]|nr:5-formyltetrahydrofolate cyclo-ligase [Rhodospirillaceae bacterium]
MDSLKKEKEAARAGLRVRRKQAAESGAVEAAFSLRDVFMSRFFCPQGLLIASYIPQGSEIDPMPLLEVLENKGHKFCLPCTAEGNSSLVFRAYRFGDPFHLGKKGIPEPVPSSPIVYPDMMLVPLVGFDRSGHRLGQGGGYYDRTLKQHRAYKKVIAVGLAFATQEEPKLPFGENDAPLDAVVTEKEVLKFSPSCE